MAQASDTDRRQLSITPWGAFAAAAVIVSALGLAFSLGRYVPIEPVTPRQSNDTFNSVYNQPPITFDKLQVDRGNVH